MSMAPISTSTDAMAAAQVVMANQADEFEALRMSVRNQMSTLGASWTGKAAMIYQDAMQRWDAAFGRIIDRLTGMAQGMHTNAGVISDADAGTTQAASSINVGLPNV
jgi:WXG100 family type VII secretion target